VADVVQRLVRVHYRKCYQSSVQARSVAFYEKLPIEEQKIFIRPLTRQIEHDDAAVIHIEKGDAGGGMMIHTIYFFRSFIDDPFVFGKIAAAHALSDCHAMGAIARTALALAVVPYSAVEDITEETLTSMLSGASDVLNAEQCALVGGHTCEGSELALGFAVNGFISNPSKIFRKRGGRIGDAIVLTKPLGTGALFAANMRAKGRSLAIHVSEALQSMSQSNVTASRIELNYNNHIHMHGTDVTEFGLIGHSFTRDACHQ
jgi:selenide,water dikinase